MYEHSVNLEEKSRQLTPYKLRIR